jgi:hypothetical protein
MNRKSLWLLPSLICFAASFVLAQQKAPPPPKPPDDGPSLRDTMKFIQENLNSIGPIKLVDYIHNNITGENLTVQTMLEISKVNANPDSCIVSYHHKSVFNASPHDFDFLLRLKAVKRIVVVSMEQDLKKSNSALGHPELNSRVDPPAFVLEAVMSNENDQKTFYFLDADLAERVSKAMVRAVKLCGGGK